MAWNPTFESFADYWGFEPRRCRPYRAQTKGRVESGVKYIKHSFLPGRELVDIVDLTEQLRDWTDTIADVRIHGTTHERPIDRFDMEPMQRRAVNAETSFPSMGPGHNHSHRISTIWFGGHHSSSTGLSTGTSNVDDDI